MPKKRSKKQSARTTRSIEKKECSLCHKVKALAYFYRSYNPYHTDGYLPMCKECLKNACYDEDKDEVSLEKLQGLLRQMDRPFLITYYNSAIKQHESKYVGRRKPKKACLEIVGWYFKNIQTLRPIRNLNWEEGVEYNKILTEREKQKKQEQKVNDLLAEDGEEIYDEEEGSEISLNDVKLFGEGYSPLEYKRMKEKYNFLLKNYSALTNLHVEALVTYVRYKVKEELAVAKGNVTEAKNWGELAQKAADKAKINPSQLSQSDLQGGINSFSEFFQAIEQAEDIVPILPQFKYRPNDAPDFIIWCYINYIRDLEGKPPCTYEEVYKFYDRKVADYIRQYGDPYGIFKDAPTKENRKRIKQFIKMPDENSNETQEEES